jgi:ketosteroid isomerase-like protein
MRNLLLTACLALMPLPLALAQPAHSHHPVAAAAVDVDQDAADAVGVVEAFSKALVEQDLEAAARLLADDVLILETGGAERSRDEYLGHHARADAKFLAGSHHKLKLRKARVAGDLAWVGSQSELHASRAGKPLQLSSTETMVLRRTPEGWRIVHIHWSSRPAPGK